MKVIFSPRCLEYRLPRHPEGPKRISSVFEFLKQKGGFEFIESSSCTDEDILLAHSPALLEKVKKRDFFDADTPNLPKIFEYASLSAGAAIRAQELCLQEDSFVFSLMRPPGHHATKENLGGFCYFNNIAIAIKKSLAKINKAAVLDLDVHHGNGTEDIFLGNQRLLYASLHQSPHYPGTGLASRENCLNYPLLAGSDEEVYLDKLSEALEKIKAFKPDILGISLGFDTYKEDPLGNLNLEVSTYGKIGTMIKGLGIRAFGVLEGGYTLKIGECLYEFILGLGEGNLK